MRNIAFVNLSTIRKNAIAVKRLLPNNTKFCAVVKADAYGHGATVVANALYSIADYFAVAITEEGIALRLSGIDKPILVLTKIPPSDYERALYYNLTLTVSSAKELTCLHRACVKFDKTVNVHIKFNSGMNRQGADLSELKLILKKADKCPRVKIVGLYSHYALPENDKERNKATFSFLLANKLVKGYNSNVISHISASGGTLKGEFFDMVRIGIMLYGYKPFDTNAVDIKPAMKVYANVVARRKLNKGDSALYGKKKVKSLTDITLVRYGYADGLFRRQVGGVYNNRCMDVSALIGVNKHTYKVNVIKDVYALSRKYRTIPYEILVKSALRADKIYKNL